MEFFTLKQVSERIASRKEDVDLVARRVRHWTNEKLIDTVDKPHSGKGRHRRYHQEGLMIAAILWELSRYDVPIGVLEKILPALDELADEYIQKAAVGKMNATIIRDTLSGTTPLWLAVIYDEAKRDFICRYIRVRSGIQRLIEDDSVIILNIRKITHRVNNP
jgi:DNA-binding transcriptional MerR regulator